MMIMIRTTTTTTTVMMINNDNKNNNGNDDNDYNYCLFIFMNLFTKYIKAKRTCLLWPNIYCMK